MIYNRILQILPKVVRSSIDHIHNQHPSPPNYLDTKKTKQQKTHGPDIFTRGNWELGEGYTGGGNEVVLGIPVLYVSNSID